MSRTALDGFPFGDAEKKYLVSLINRLRKVYLTEILGFCCMGNHFHLLTRMLPEADFTDKEIKKRYEICYGKDRDFTEGQIPFSRTKWSSLSEFVNDLHKQVNWLLDVPASAYNNLQDSWWRFKGT
jgi:REP element-mobilizing transposase RayT